MAHKITNNQSFILISGGGGLVCLSKYRKEFMGVATICILLCHTSAYANLPGVIIAICNLLIIGVGLFLFLSGFGLYYSLVKLNNDRGSLVKWYSHRYLRIGIPYF